MRTLVLPYALTITKNTGKLISKGIETELVAMPFKVMEVSYNFGYTDAKNKNLKIAQNGGIADFKETIRYLLQILLHFSLLSILLI